MEVNVHLTGEEAIAYLLSRETPEAKTPAKKPAPAKKKAKVVKETIPWSVVANALSELLKAMGGGAENVKAIQDLFKSELGMDAEDIRTPKVEMHEEMLRVITENMPDE